MVEKLRIALVGMGKRLQNDYMPIFEALSNDFEIVGLTTKNYESGKIKSEKFGIKHCSNLDELNAQEPDIFLICVPAEVSCEVAKNIIKFKKPIMMETPVYDGSVVQEAKANNIKFGVIEQWPFLPLEQVKKKVIETGVLGGIFMVENDNRSYDYHGIAQLRSYLGLDLVPKSVTGFHFGCTPPSFENETGRKGSGYEGWDHGVVQMSNGSSLVHRFCYNFKMAPFRFMQSLRIHGTKGMIVNWCTERRCYDYENMKISFLNEKNGKFEKPEIIFDKEGEITREISIKSESINICWKNPYSNFGFTDQETAIATYMHQIKASIQDSKPVPYSLDNAFVDTLLVHLIKQSARNGSKPISLG